MKVSHPRLPTVALLVAGALLACGVAAAITHLATGVPNLFLDDDAYFYLQIAWNIAEGHGSTFDGMNATNGFHLLWMGVLAPIAALVHGAGFGKSAFLFTAAAVSVGVVLWSAASAFRTPAERALASMLFVLGGVTMEATLLAALLLVLVRGILGELAIGAPWLFVLAALVPLTRIDFFWLPAGLALAILPAPFRNRRFQTMALGTLAGVAAYFALEQLLFGLWTSVSSAHKADDLSKAGAELLRLNLGSAGNLLRGAVLCCLGALGAWGVWRRAQSPSRRLGALAIAGLPVFGYLILAELRDWYFTASLLTTLLLASREWPPESPVWRGSVRGLTAIVVAASVAYLVVYRADRRQTAQFVTHANLQLSPRDVVYVVDGSGFMGWRLNAHVVNGDGLVNSWAYRRRVRDNALGGYLAEIGATHVITNSPRIEAPIISWRGLRVDEASLLVDTGPTRNRYERYRLYELTHPGRVTFR